MSQTVRKSSHLQI